MITANDIVQSQVFADAMRELKNDLLETFMGLDTSDKDGMQIISHKLWALSQVGYELERMARDERKAG